MGLLSAWSAHTRNSSECRVHDLGHTSHFLPQIQIQMQIWVPHSFQHQSDYFPSHESSCTLNSELINVNFDGSQWHKLKGHLKHIATVVNIYGDYMHTQKWDCFDRVTKRTFKSQEPNVSPCVYAHKGESSGCVSARSHLSVLVGENRNTLTRKAKFLTHHPSYNGPLL